MTKSKEFARKIPGRGSCRTKPSFDGGAIGKTPIYCGAMGSQAQAKQYCRGLKSLDLQFHTYSWPRTLLLTGNSSLVIDDLLKVPARSFPVAFFYFNYREAHQQDPQAILSCLLRQVAATLDEIPPELMQMKLSKGDSGRMNLEDCKQMMAICLAETERTYLILDGLDECDLAKHRKILLETLHYLAQLPETKLFVTSRSHIQDIGRSFHNIPQLTVVAHDEDLEEYMVEELRSSPSSVDLDEELATRIRAQIRQRANGM